MGLFSWLFGRDEGGSTSTMPVVNTKNSPGTYDVDVVGESHYQEALERICGGRAEDSQRVEVKALLVPEEDNPHDSKAVRVDIEDQTVGYLDGETARSYRERMAEAELTGVVVRCDAIIVGGWDRGDGDRGHFGVKLDLPTA